MQTTKTHEQTRLRVIADPMRAARPDQPGRPARGLRPLVIAAILIFTALGAAAIPLVLAQLPNTNAAGGSLVRETAEASSFSEQTNAAGAKLQVTGLADAAFESRNAAGATMFAGQFSGEVFRNGAGISWTMYEEK